LTQLPARRRSLGSSLVAARPVVVLDLRLPAGGYDINVTPDKRAIMLHGEAALMAALQQVRRLGLG
jgi:DNA mismatch repair ATPase MutL